MERFPPISTNVHQSFPLLSILNCSESIKILAILMSLDFLCMSKDQIQYLALFAGELDYDTQVGNSILYPRPSYFEDQGLSRKQSQELNLKLRRETQSRHSVTGITASMQWPASSALLQALFLTSFFR